jgi:hypothetical protein
MKRKVQVVSSYPKPGPAHESFSPQAPAGKVGTVCKSATGPRPLESKRTANSFLSPFIRAFQSKASLEFIYR